MSFRGSDATIDLWPVADVTRHEQDLCGKLHDDGRGLLPKLHDDGRGLLSKLHDDGRGLLHEGGTSGVQDVAQTSRVEQPTVLCVLTQSRRSRHSLSETRCSNIPVVMYFIQFEECSWYITCTHNIYRGIKQFSVTAKVTYSDTFSETKN